MAAPPPQNDQEPTAITFGIAAMDEYLVESELEFPASRTEILESLGNRAVPYDPRGNTMALETALEETGRAEFGSRRELQNALHPVFEEKRERSGLGGWLKSLLPFTKS
ncbi:MAG: hypothetical protein ACOCTH_03095 [Halodesulfurarchaeum sp.]